MNDCIIFYFEYNFWSDSSNKIKSDHRISASLSGDPDHADHKSRRGVNSIILTRFHLFSMKKIKYHFMTNLIKISLFSVRIIIFR